MPLPSLDGVRVLVVEDDFDARILIRRMLEDAAAGHRDLRRRLRHRVLEAVRPAIVVSDIALPHQDGYDLIRRIRERYRADVLPAIALTAFARQESQQGPRRRLPGASLEAGRAAAAADRCRRPGAGRAASHRPELVRWRTSLR